MSNDCVEVRGIAPPKQPQVASGPPNKLQELVIMKLAISIILIAEASLVYTQNKQAADDKLNPG
ncbi:hypothetical protein ACFLUP_04490 [Chloroflexota bacterium]